MIKKKKLNLTITKTIIFTNIGFFLLSLLVTGSELKLSIHPFSALTPSIESLISLGASGTIPINIYHEYWSLITANYLHGSLLHIIFNMLAFNQIASLISIMYGKNRMFIIFTITGIFGFFLSYLAGVKVTIGASAAICGLIGAALYYGKSKGGTLGQNVYKQTMGWVIFIALFGAIIPNVNNWGHGGGFVSGIFIAWVLGYNEKSHENSFHKFFSCFLMGATFCALFWSLIFCLKLQLYTH